MKIFNSFISFALIFCLFSISYVSSNPEILKNKNENDTKIIPLSERTPETCPCLSFCVACQSGSQPGCFDETSCCAIPTNMCSQYNCQDFCVCSPMDCPDITIFERSLSTKRNSQSPYRFKISIEAEPENFNDDRENEEIILKKKKEIF